MNSSKFFRENKHIKKSTKITKNENLNEKNDSLKNIIKSISKNRIIFATDGIEDTKSDTDTGEDEQQAEKDVVSKMAKSAMKRRS